MYRHSQLGETNFTRSRRLFQLIAAGTISLGGYEKGKIYGLLTCKSGMRMKMTNQIFFKNEQEALAMGYRPCGSCLPGNYHAWKASSTK
jgi:methylphosphotriester-DNA--protein-cysteine methyltransferase